MGKSPPRPLKAKQRTTNCLTWVSRFITLLLGLVIVLILSVHVDVQAEVHTMLESTFTTADKSTPTNTSSTLSLKTAKLNNTIAYAVTVTDCGRNASIPFPISEGAAVLRHSIHRSSVHGKLGGRYDYQMYAFYHPDAKDCMKPLEKLGYKLLERKTPVDVTSIQSDFLREKIGVNGCCGEKELIKFEAFRLTDYDLVVILDLDVLVLKPLDMLFDLVLYKRRPSAGHIMWPARPLPEDIQLLYTIDYAMVPPGRANKPIQGGFVVLRPNEKVYHDIVTTVLTSNYTNKGWDGTFGRFWGDMTFQGLLPYYFLHKNSGHAVELNRCVHNNMVSDPRTRASAGQPVCYTLEEKCEDCRSRPVEEVYSTHFTLCQKPWLCVPHTRSGAYHRLCSKLTDEWFRVRSELEQSWGRSGFGSGNWSHAEKFYGYCKDRGIGGYELIKEPYGRPLEQISEKEKQV